VLLQAGLHPPLASILGSGGKLPADDEISGGDIRPCGIAEHAGAGLVGDDIASGRPQARQWAPDRVLLILALGENGDFRVCEIHRWFRMCPGIDMCQ
jgi:hypothetical protein